MRRVLPAFAFLVLVLFLAAPCSNAAAVTLARWTFFHQVGADAASVYDYDLGSGDPAPTLPNTLPLSFNLVSLDPVSGLGQVTVKFSGAGTHKLIGLFDLEIDEETNTFFNEFGEISGVFPAGVSFEIDEPGYVYGDIVNNAKNGALDNTNGVPGSAPDDVTMALGWQVLLTGGESATVVFRLGETAPASGAYLKQVDPDSAGAVYMSMVANIDSGGDGGEVPEPSTWMMFATGAALLASALRRRK